MSKRMTLVEMLEQVIVEHNAEFNKVIKDATDHQNVAHTAVLVGLMSAKEYFDSIYNKSFNKFKHMFIII